MSADKCNMTNQIFQFEPIKLLNYTVGSEIGEGTFGKVKYGTHLITQQKVAIKILHKHKITDHNDRERVAREIKILKLASHPNVIRMLEVLESTSSIYIIMEYAENGELYEYIVKNKIINEIEASYYFKQLIDVIEYLHSMQIAHRDLKPENILLTRNKTIKVIDFGLSNIYNNDASLKTACGSPSYASPEMIAGNPYKPIMADIWSAGVILYAMLYGVLPFDDSNIAVLYSKIVTGKLEFPNDVFVSDEAVQLLKGILNVDANKRYSLNRIKSSKFVRKLFNVDICKKEASIIDEYIISVLSSYFNRVLLLDDIRNKRHNAMTSTYYILQSLKRSGDPTFTIDDESIPSDKCYDRNRDISYIDAPRLKSNVSNYKTKRISTIRKTRATINDLLQEPNNHIINKKINGMYQKYKTAHNSIDANQTLVYDQLNISDEKNAAKKKQKPFKLMPHIVIDMVKSNKSSKISMVKTMYTSTHSSNNTPMAAKEVMLLSNYGSQRTNYVIQKHVGPYIMNYVTTKKPEKQMAIILRTLSRNGYDVLHCTPYYICCRKELVKFEIKIMELENIEELYFIKFNCVTGHDPNLVLKLQGHILDTL